MRKVFEIDADIAEALKLLAADSGKSIDALADEAFGLLLKKHCRPKSLKEALQWSLRRFARNDNESCQPSTRAR